MIPYIIILMLYILMSAMEGQYYRTKALLYKYLPLTGTGQPIYISFPKEKIWLNTLRLIILVGFALETSWLESLGMACVFPLLHDGVYNMVRKYYNNTRPGFFGHSDEDTSWVSIPLWVRIVLLAIGIAIIIYARLR